MVLEVEDVEQLDDALVAPFGGHGIPAEGDALGILKSGHVGAYVPLDDLDEFGPWGGAVVVVTLGRVVVVGRVVEVVVVVSAAASESLPLMAVPMPTPASTSAAAPRPVATALFMCSAFPRWLPGGSSTLGGSAPARLRLPL